ncbi:MAG: hypothetical protein ACRCZI_02420 [Cetobacterium sp.]
MTIVNFKLIKEFRLNIKHKVYMFKCTNCSKKFIEERYLTKHKSKFHEDDVETLPNISKLDINENINVETLQEISELKLESIINNIGNNNNSRQNFIRIITEAYEILNIYHDPINKGYSILELIFIYGSFRTEIMRLLGNAFDDDKFCKFFKNRDKYKDIKIIIKNNTPSKNFIRYIAEDFEKMDSCNDNVNKGQFLIKLINLYRSFRSEIIRVTGSAFNDAMFCEFAEKRNIFRASLPEIIKIEDDEVFCEFARKRNIYYI